MEASGVKLQRTRRREMYGRNCRSFGVAMKEAVKWVTSWAAFYDEGKGGEAFARRTNFVAKSGTGHPPMVLL